MSFIGRFIKTRPVRHARPFRGKPPVVKPPVQRFSTDAKSSAVQDSGVQGSAVQDASDNIGETVFGGAMAVGSILGVAHDLTKNYHKPTVASIVGGATAGALMGLAWPISIPVLGVHYMLHGGSDHDYDDMM
jgi:hypothetical protein